MSPNNNNSFFDPKTILAIGVTFLLFMGWNSYMQKKYPHLYAKNAVKKTQSIDPKNTNAVITEENAKKQESQNLEGTPQVLTKKVEEALLPEEEILKVEDEVWALEFSSYGFELKNAELKTYKERDFSNKKFSKLFKTAILNSKENLIFNLEQQDNKIIGIHQSSYGIIKKIITLDSQNYSMRVGYEFQGEFPGLSTYLEMQVEDTSAGSMFMPNFDRQEYFAVSNGESNRDFLAKEGFASRVFDNVSILSFANHYFGQAVLDNSTLKPSALVYAGDKENIFARLDYAFTPQVRSFEISQKYFIGPKDDAILKSVDAKFVELINFGIFKVICYPILSLLKFFYSLSANYGIAIILLTLLIRILVFPLAYKGYKSMAKMQKIQPQLKAIREKYKNDSQKANLETMALMKEAQVNPLGGCMPMLLQIPIFFALYRVLSESVVMYQAPFMFWIQDLSLKDPYFVLPFLMGVTMFIQQKITPTAMDPMQQKILMFMPIIFSIFMISLPSALTLYIFVSTLFGVLQQYIFTKAKN